MEALGVQQKISGGFQLSPQQRHLWALQQSDGAVPWRARSVIEIEGPLDVKALAAAVNKVIRQNEALQLSFQRLPGMTVPLQLSNKQFAVNWTTPESWDNLDSHQQQDRIETFFQTEGDPDSASMSLVKLSEKSHVLLVDLPALCCDLRGLENLKSEIARSYEETLVHKDTTVDSLRYTVLSEWLNQLLESEDSEAGRAYWRTENTSANFELRLPSERTAPSSTTFLPRSFKVELEELPSLAEQNETSLRAVLLAVYQILLWRLSGEAMTTAGVAHDGRPDEELVNSIGLFTKYLPLNCRFDAHLQFSEIVQRVSAADRAAGEWQECFAWDQRETNGTRPFISYCFTFEQDAVEVTGNVKFTSGNKQALFDRFKLNLSCRQAGERLSLEFQYDPNFFEAKDVQRLAEQFQTLLRSVIANPEETICRLNLLPPGERKFLLDTVNDTEFDFGAVDFIPSVFENQVERDPQAVAVIFGTESLTYQELNERSNQLANYLRRRHVGPDVMVGVCLERSLEMIVALLGILKAGGAYVPLDPVYPQEHLSFLLKDTGVKLLLTSRALADADILPETSAQMVFLDGAATEVIKQESTNPVRRGTPDNLAYVIYTSGSTGTPKGVMISHRSICNRLFWTQHNFPLSAADTVLQKTVYSFDASVWEIFVPLLAGARLVMAEPGGQQDSAYLVNAIIEHQVTTLQLVPSMLRVLLEADRISECTSLRLVFCGGEALTSEVVAAFRQRLDAKLVNLYGPTEASIDATSNSVDELPEERIVPLGKPLANVQVYLLDVQQNPVPTGVQGEIHIGGVGLARGYLHRPELTAEKFIPNPFSSVPGQRLYRTGDLARQSSDGTIHFQGRTDHQIKLRGFRIELGEIEAALRQHALVSESLVLLREDVPGDQRLVAYAIAAQSSESEIRDYLKGRLAGSQPIFTGSP